LEKQRTIRRGTDQPIYNYLLQMNDIEVNRKLSSAFFLTHLQRFDWLSHNWQTNDKIPFFIKYGYIWFYSGFPQRGQRYDLMKNTWEAIKGNYN
jgi:hypothetical protein